MLRYVLNSVNTEIEGLIKIVLCAKCDQIEIKSLNITEAGRNRCVTHFLSER